MSRSAIRLVATAAIMMTACNDRIIAPDDPPAGPLPVPMMSVLPLEIVTTIGEGGSPSGTYSSLGPSFELGSLGPATAGVGFSKRVTIDLGFNSPTSLQAQVDYGDGSDISTLTVQSSVIGFDGGEPILGHAVDLGHTWTAGGSYRVILAVGGSTGVTTKWTTIAVDAVTCGPGSYPHLGACVPAPAGSYVAPGATEATPCAPGTYQPQPGMYTCILAAPGTYVAAPGATESTPCAPGTYQPQPGMYTCILAAPGTYVAAPGATASTPCAPGTYQPQPGMYTCILAAPGTYVAAPGATASTPCPVGTTTLAAGSTSVEDCLAATALLMLQVDQAIASGALTGAADGIGGQQQLTTWREALHRSIGFLSGPQQQAGCTGLVNSYRTADGLPAPKDMVGGTARPAIAERIRQLISEQGCGQ